MQFRISIQLRHIILGVACISVLALLEISCGQREHSEEIVGTTLLDSINEAIRKNPEAPQNYVRRAAIHRDSANYGDAISDMAQAMRLDSVNEQYHHLLAEIYLRSAKSQFAIGTLERAAMLFPESTTTLLKLAEMHLILKQYDRTAALLRQVLTLEPQNTDALFLLGLMYREQGNIDRAIQSYQTIVELDSENAEAWTMLGNLLDEKGDSNALQCFENAIEINPKYVQGWHSKAYYLQNHGRIPEAISIYKQIHQIDSSYADAWLNRGVLYLEMDSVSAAKGCFDQLISMDSLSVIGYYYAGIAAQKAGDLDGARKHLNHALKLDPASPRIQAALDELK